jgi:ABC-type phosphonate transport system ATPase subunit
MSMRATRRIVVQVAWKVLEEKPRNGLTATKCFNGHIGAIRPHAAAIAASISSR